MVRGKGARPIGEQRALIVAVGRANYRRKPALNKEASWQHNW
jgi:hypothetical protein